MTEEFINDYDKIINMIEQLVCGEEKDGQIVFFSKEEISKKAFEAGNRGTLSETEKNVLFKEIFGYTVEQYIQKRRMNHVYEMITANTSGHLEWDLYLNCCGYSDQKNFSTEFKKAYLVTPSDALKKRTKAKSIPPKYFSNLSPEERVRIEEKEKKYREYSSPTVEKNKLPEALSIFGIDKDSLSEALKAMDMQNVYELNNLESEFAYNLHKKYNLNLVETFEYVWNYIWKERENSERDSRIKEDLENTDVIYMYFTLGMGFNEIYQVLCMRTRYPMKCEITDAKKDYLVGYGRYYTYSGERIIHFEEYLRLVKMAQPFEKGDEGTPVLKLLLDEGYLRLVKMGQPFEKDDESTQVLELLLERKKIKKLSDFPYYLARCIDYDEIYDVFCEKLKEYEITDEVKEAIIEKCIVFMREERNWVEGVSVSELVAELYKTCSGKETEENNFFYRKWREKRQQEEEEQRELIKAQCEYYNYSQMIREQEYVQEEQEEDPGMYNPDWYEEQVFENDYHEDEDFDFNEDDMEGDYYTDDYDIEDYEDFEEEYYFREDYFQEPEEEYLDIREQMDAFAGFFDGDQRSQELIGMQGTDRRLTMNKDFSINDFLFSVCEKKPVKVV